MTGYNPGFNKFFCDPADQYGRIHEDDIPNQVFVQKLLNSALYELYVNRNTDEFLSDIRHIAQLYDLELSEEVLTLDIQK